MHIQEMVKTNRFGAPKEGPPLEVRQREQSLDTPQIGENVYFSRLGKTLCQCDIVDGKGAVDVRFERLSGRESQAVQVYSEEDNVETQLQLRGDSNMVETADPFNKTLYGVSKTLISGSFEPSQQMLGRSAEKFT